MRIVLTQIRLPLRPTVRGRVPSTTQRAGWVGHSISKGTRKIALLAEAGSAITVLPGCTGLPAAGGCA